ncbi:hatching enzyme 1.2-like [Eriocheir sinensis]|uniref:hatching enzyme 1.2-like n=1 Tax=Eriocheir sinensis TaxID=95602 RepID=UPI0021C65D07|nr:hatching enzyme 1.2-like [Eriocheir sinensis]
MGAVSAVLWWTVLVVAARSAAGRHTFLDTSSKLAEHDILGAPITEEEFKASLTLEIIEPAEDPTTKSGHFQGDIILESEDQLIQIFEDHPDAQNSATSNENNLWPGGVIPYVISSSYNYRERQVIARAMEELSSETCLTFVPRTFHYDYIHIYKGYDCSSAVGRNGGRQRLSLGDDCMYVGIVIHELLHAVGFWHEHTRYDRDDYVYIIEENIMDNKKHNFYKQSKRSSTDLDLPYDYASIMHYKSTEFAIGDGPTIVPYSPYFNAFLDVEIGQRRGLSDLDVEGVKQLYKCPVRIVYQPPRQTGWFWW